MCDTKLIKQRATFCISSMINWTKPLERIPTCIICHMGWFNSKRYLEGRL